MRIRIHTNPLKYFERLQPLGLDKVDMEIGFGMGEFIMPYATQFPDRQIIGVDVRHQVVEKLTNRVASAGLSNIQVIHSNGQIVLEDCVKDRSVERLFIFHPDPWVKKRHHKRRIVTEKFLDVVSQKLALDGTIYLSTDSAFLWEDMSTLFAADPRYVLTDDPVFWDSYSTGWHQLSLRENRETFRGVYCLKPTPSKPTPSASRRPPLPGRGEESGLKRGHIPSQGGVPERRGGLTQGVSQSDGVGL